MIKLAILVVLVLFAMLVIFGSAVVVASIERDREHDEHEGGLPL